jgi:hypothetical protein
MPYKYGFEEWNLFVEQGTERVPDDDQYYIVHNGEVVEACSDAKRALARLQQVLLGLSMGVQPAGGVDPRTRAMQAEMVDSFLRQSSQEKRAKATRKGGKGGSGGVGG